MGEITRRGWLALPALGLVTGKAQAMADEASVADLAVSRLSTPLGLEDSAPRFSWRMNTSRPGAGQGAYRIVVIAEGVAVWDSGRVASARSTGLRYEGPALSSRRRYDWTVEVWDERGDRFGVGQSWWEMGLLQPADWTAKWLAVESEQEREDRLAGLPYHMAPAPPEGRSQKFRLAFKAEAECEALITFAVQGQLVGAWLDGGAIDVPVRDPNAFGELPAIQLERRLPAGEHVLAVEVIGLKGPLAPSTVGVAAQARLQQATGRIHRHVAGWLVSDEADGAWQTTVTHPAKWRPVAPVTPALTPPWPPTPARLLRRSFQITKPVVRARLYLAALGAYAPRLNGKPVGDARLAGESTDFGKRVLYRVHDVGDGLRRGENVLGLMVGDGWFASYQAPANRYPYGEGPRRALAQLELLYEDGTAERIITDERWRATASHIMASDLYAGEDQDGRLERRGWDAPGFVDADWDEVRIAPAPAAPLAAQTAAPIRVTRTLRPISIREPTPGVFVFDFGQNFAGWARLRVKARPGDRIVMRFAELLRDDGTADQRNLRGARASDSYIARGEGEEAFEPQFTYHGFRYVQVEGLRGRPGKRTLEGAVANTDLPETGRLETGSTVLDRVAVNALWSQRSNFIGIPTDCPQRDERLGWSGDAAAYWDAAAFNMDVYAFTRRYMDEMRGAQKANGAFPIWAPMDSRTTTSPLTALPTPGWADAGITLPWIAAGRYGDTAIIDENWDAMRRFVDGVLERNPDYVWRQGRGIDFGDWLSVDATYAGEATTPKDLLATALLIQCFDRMADMAGWSQREAEASTYRAHAERGRQAFAQFITADGVVGNGSHTSYALANALNLVPNALQAKVNGRFVAAIRDRGTMLTCGFIGTPIAMDAVARTGDLALVYDLLLREAYPSWGYMVRKGATTMWERWNSDVGDVAMNSYNHYAFGAVVGFLYRRIAGIEAAAPGFAHLSMRPLLSARLGNARAEYRSVRGVIAAQWRTRGDGFEYEVNLPGNTTAEVRLPASRIVDIRFAGGRSDTADLVEHADGVAVFRLAAGVHTLSVA